MRYEISAGDQTRVVQVEQDPRGGWRVSLDGGTAETVRGARVGAAEWVFRRGDRAQRVAVAAVGDVAHVQRRGDAHLLQVVDPSRRALSFGEHEHTGAVVTQMPGVVVRVLVSAGQRVAKGAPLLVVEAMKMENEFDSPCDGVVESVSVTAGQPVESGALLVTVVPVVPDEVA